MYHSLLGFHTITPPCGVTNVTGQCGCNSVTDMSGPSSATPQGSQSNSLGFPAKVLDAWTNARPMKCRAMKWLRLWHFYYFFVFFVSQRPASPHQP